MPLFYTNSILLQCSCIETFWTQITTCKLFLFYFYLKAKFSFVKKITNAHTLAGKMHIIFFFPGACRALNPWADSSWAVGSMNELWAWWSVRSQFIDTASLTGLPVNEWRGCVLWLRPAQPCHFQNVTAVVWIPRPLSQIGELWQLEVGA